MTYRSLELRINSVDDARAVVRDLENIKRRWQQEKCDSVEFLIHAPLMNDKEVTNLLGGTIGWCKVFKRELKAIDGNTFYAPPHFSLEMSSENRLLKASLKKTHSLDLPFPEKRQRRSAARAATL